MPVWRVVVPPHVGEVIRHLPPEVKRGVKAAVRAVTADPAVGEPLGRDLEGLWSFRARRYRIVYAVDRAAHVIRIFAVGHRRTIYDEIAERIRRRPRG